MVTGADGGWAKCNVHGSRRGPENVHGSERDGVSLHEVRSKRKNWTYSRSYECQERSADRLTLTLKFRAFVQI